MKAAVLGSPIDHSLSPVLHRAAYQALELADWHYAAYRVGKAELPAFVMELDDTWAGLSLTMPLKVAAIGLLSAAENTVTLTGSCNTLLLPSGRGYNTDVDGMVVALAEAGFTAAAAPVVLGGGATAASAVAAVARLGATAVTLAVRDQGRAVAALRTAVALGLRITMKPLAGLALDGADLVVSTLPPGAADPLARQLMTTRATLLDVVYEPWPTSLAAAWQRGGGRVVPGDAMLLHQAARQVTLMTGMPAPVEAMRAAMADERSRRAGDAGVPSAGLNR